jgi:hypothetical protein
LFNATPTHPFHVVRSAHTRAHGAPPSLFTPRAGCEAACGWCPFHVVRSAHTHEHGAIPSLFTSTCRVRLLHGRICPLARAKTCRGHRVAHPACSLLFTAKVDTAKIGKSQVANGPADGDGARGARGRKPRGADERGARTRRQSPMLRLCPAAATGRVVLACARDLHPAPRPACGSDETAQKRAMVCGDDWPRPPSANLSQQHAGRGRPDGEGG